MKTRAERWEDLAETLGKGLLFLYTGLGSCSLTYGRPVIAWVMRAAFLLCGAVLLRRLFRWRRFRAMPLLPWALLLWASGGISLAANRRYVSRDGLVYLILWAFWFFLLYAQPADRSRAAIERRFRRLSAAYLLWTTALALLSVGMLAAGWGFHYRDPANAGYEVAAGFFSGRLWGAFQDPNLGAVMGCLGIGICLYWIAALEDRRLCVLLAADGGLMLYYIAMSDSRTGLVCLGALCAVGVLFLPRAGSSRVWKTVLLAGGTVLCGALAAKAVQAVYNAAASAGAAARMVDRGYSLAGDLSNRRLSIWRSGLQIGLRRPLTGASFTGVVAWAREHLPETYILTNDLWVFNTFDSEPVNLFAAQGFPGVLIAGGWAVLAARRYVRGIAAARTRGRELFLLTAVCAVLAVSALFQGTMFYQVTPNTFLFWSAAGALMKSLPDEEEKGGTRDQIRTV